MSIALQIASFLDGAVAALGTSVGKVIGGEIPDENGIALGAFVGLISRFLTALGAGKCRRSAPSHHAPLFPHYLAAFFRRHFEDVAAIRIDTQH